MEQTQVGKERNFESLSEIINKAVNWKTFPKIFFKLGGFEKCHKIFQF